MKKFRYILIVILLIIAALPLFAQEKEAPPIYYPSPRVAGMGGAYTAYAIGPDSLFFNPAGYALPGNKDFFILDATIKLNGDSVEILKKANNVNFDMSALISDPDFINSLLSSKLGIGASGLPFIGWVGGGFGIGLFDTVNSTIVTIPSGIAPNMHIDLNADIGLITGFSLHLGPIYVGANFKYFYRLWTNYETGLLTLTSSLSDVSTYQLPFDINLGQGYGFDLGTIVKLGNIQIGIVAKDIKTTIKYYTTNNLDEIQNDIQKISDSDQKISVPMQINTGIAVYLGSIIPIILDKVVLTADIHDVNGFIEEYKAGNKYTLGTKLYLGAEARVLGLFRIRGGLYQGYPAFGLTVNLAIIQFNFTYFTRELSSIPGLMPEENFLMNISMIW